MNQQGALHCEVCNAQLPNFNSMKWHIQGKKHQNALLFWDKKKETARLSVFVRNFPMGTTEQELWQYFAQFGRVTKVSIVPPKNIFAIIEFSSADTADYVLQQTNHKLNSQNLIVKAREIEVPGQPASNKFQYGYQQFQGGRELGMGPMNRGRGGPGPGPGPGRGGYNMGYMGGAGYQAYDQGLDQGPGGSKKKKLNVEEQIEQYYHEELIEKLMKVKGVQNQLEWLCQNLQVTAEEAQTKFQLCEKLQTCLGKFFPGCTVNQFGSSVNGFGLSGCDMDIFLDLSTMHSKTWEQEPIKLPFVRDFRFLKDKEWGPLVPSDLDKMGMTDQCKLISRILMDHLEGILDVQVIPSSRCPLVRFKYTNCDVKCDLSVNNKLALQNTKLLYLFSVLNSRVRLLVYAIRYWGKVKGLAGNQKASTKLSNYALTLMVLNYLQNLDPPVLPTIEKLSQLHGTSARTKIEGWDCTFAMDWQIIPQSNNAQSAAELLSGFFSYWSAFNFEDNVLVTRSASELPFTMFFEKDNMQDGRIRSFKASAMNMQDPFVLNHNITQNVNEKMRDKIVRELRIAAIKTSVWGNEGFSMTTPSGGGDLIHLLNNEVPDIILQEDQEKQETILEKGRMPAREAGEYEFEVELKPTQMSSKLLKQLQKGENYRVEWCKKMCDFILRIIKEVLMLTIEDLPEATEEIRQRMKEEMAKKEFADKRNKEILERRRLRRMEKRKELEEKLKREEEELKKKAEEAATEAEAEAKGKEGSETEAGTSESTDKSSEKRPRPISIFDIKIEPPKKFRGNRKFELNLDDMIEDSDDGEEIIEYKPDEPELRYKRDCDAEVDYQHYMRAWCMTWARRKKAKNYLVNEEGRTEENIPMEKLISNAIWQNDRAPLAHPVVGFYCYMQSVIDGNATSVRVEMDCKEGSRDFNTFFQFTKMYLYKMIEKYFN
ncbi:speckle targeted PIP5K1A-regulated poly(A) polymerase-like [Ruditapes philippinarum]|uniref:speckle targeted PIP5K1A-regulated poly(A) polymerase-like n=1 Tax=Ruditapes philippinarum TaxID=129788 RepID=UPI00295A6759|nr:speckle targeted PIP5K1A-regulated poly(A) polymerase-like [Ruditapes philippinarum]